MLSSAHVQIVSNTTGMAADLCVQADAEGRDHCVVVVKGTFATRDDGTLSLAARQRSLVYTDEHYGAPETSCVRHECEFVRVKPLTDLLVVGKAVAPGGVPVRELMVGLEVDGRLKQALIVGERRWVRTIGGVVASTPLPFSEMPLTFDRAFGGQDDSRGPHDVAIEHRNLTGTGFHAHRGASEIEGTPLPNLEDPNQRVSGPYDRPSPVGFGCVGRTWLPRIRFAGTYDARWREEQCPFLPTDFDPRYHQCAPIDQQFERMRGGERIRCIHMAEQPVVQYVIPALDIPVRFEFEERVQTRSAELDTVILEPHCGEAMLVWRTSAPLGKRLVALRSISIGEPPRDEGREPLGYRRGKPHFAGLAATLRWLRGRRRG